MSKPEEKVKRLARQKHNCTCPNCGTYNKFGFSTVCIKFYTFVCNECKTSHQAISHRCKSLTMSSWTHDEVLELQRHGNDVARRTWLKHAPPCGQGGRPIKGMDIGTYKQFVVVCYEHKRYYGDDDGATNSGDTGNSTNVAPGQTTAEIGPSSTISPGTAKAGRVIRVSTSKKSPSTMKKRQGAVRKQHTTTAPPPAPPLLVAKDVDLLDFSAPSTASSAAPAFQADFGNFSAATTTTTTTASSISTHQQQTQNDDDILSFQADFGTTPSTTGNATTTIMFDAFSNDNTTTNNAPIGGTSGGGGGGGGGDMFADFANFSIAPTSTTMSTAATAPPATSTTKKPIMGGGSMQSSATSISMMGGPSLGQPFGGGTTTNSKTMGGMNYGGGMMKQQLQRGGGAGGMTMMGGGGMNNMMTPQQMQQQILQMQMQMQQQQQQQQFKGLGQAPMMMPQMNSHAAPTLSMNGGSDAFGGLGMGNSSTSTTSYGGRTTGQTTMSMKGASGNNNKKTIDIDPFSFQG